MSDPVRPVAVGRLALANNLTLAPMAGYTQRAFRMLARHYGAALTWTEMISAYEVIRPGRKTRRLLQIVPEDRPLGIQIFGADPHMMADAAAAAQRHGGFDLVDVNFACPVRKVISRGNGGAMLRTPDLALRIIEAMRRATTLPLTIKVRKAFDESPDSRRTVRDFLAAAQDLGIDAVTIHGRTVTQIYHGRADWDAIYETADTLRIPVFGSGDLIDPEGIVAHLRHPTLAGVALARGAVGSPWIFRDILQVAAGRTPDPIDPAERVECFRRHYQILRDELGDYTAIRVMRRFGMFYSKGLLHAPDTRLALGKARSADDLDAVIRAYFEPPFHP